MVAEEHGLLSLHFGQGRVAGLTLILCGICRSRSIAKSEMASDGAGMVGGRLGFDLHSTGWSGTPGKQRQKAARPPRGQPGTGPASFPWHSMVKASHRALLMREAARSPFIPPRVTDPDGVRWKTQVRTWVICFPRLEPFLRAFAHAVCIAGDPPLSPASQIGLTSAYPSSRRHHFPGGLSRAPQPSVVLLEQPLLLLSHRPLQLECHPHPVPCLHVAGALGYLSSEGIHYGCALRTPPQRASHLDAVLVMDPETELSVQDVY